MNNELIKIENGSYTLDKFVMNDLVLFEKEMKEIKEKYDSMKQAILEEMSNKCIFKIETDDIRINYISATEKETLDTKRLKAEHKELCDEYTSFSPVKESIRISIKNKE